MEEVFRVKEETGIGVRWGVESIVLSHCYMLK